MEIKYNSLNKIAQFHNLNQGDETWSKMACTIFAPPINYKYNCGKRTTEKKLHDLVISQHEKGEFSFTKGGKGRDGINAFLEGKDANLAIFGPNDTKELLDWINRGYMAVIGIKVNSKFYKDAKDGKIEDYKDYGKYKGNIGHFTNIAKWTGRFTYDGKNYKGFILDSYAYNKRNSEWMYECDIEDVLESFAMNTKYIIF